MSDIQTVQVNLEDRSYPVFIGRGARHELAAQINPSVRRIAVVTQDGVPAQLIPDFADLERHTFVIGDGEIHKTLDTVQTLCRSFSEAGITRSDLVIGVGGGLVTDVAGFTAAVYHRGLGVMHVATTLLGMIDAAIGGKTGVNIPEGKNLIGSYWQPQAVACDMDALLSLGERDLQCGYGEMAKYHFISRQDLSLLPLGQRIARCVQIKADIVASDERESGQRALLNYGHTLAHAVEIATNFTMPHGVAVSVGILYAAHLAQVMGRIPESRVQEHYDIVHGIYNLQTVLPADFDSVAAITSMRRDKKALSSLTFVLDSADGLQIVDGILEQDLKQAFDALRSRQG